MDEESYRKAKTYAWGRLARKSQPSVELRKHLAHREYSEEIIERVILECQNSGYLDDVAWINAYVKGQISRHQSPRAIAFKLQNKGLPRDQIQSTLEELCGEEERAQGIRALIDKKKGKLDLQDRKQRDKLIAGILRKGFKLSEILNIINEN